MNITYESLLANGANPRALAKDKYKQTEISELLIQSLLLPPS